MRSDRTPEELSESQENWNDFYGNLRNWVNSDFPAEEKEKLLQHINTYEMAELVSTLSELERDKERETLEKEIFQAHPIHKDPFYVRLIKIAKTIKNQNTQKQCLEKIEDNQLSELQGSSWNIEKERNDLEKEIQNIWQKNPIHKNPFYVRLIKIAKTIKNSDAQKNCLEKIEDNQLAESRKDQNTAWDKEKERDELEKRIEEALYVSLSKSVSTLSSSSQQKKFLADIKRAQSKEIFINHNLDTLKLKLEKQKQNKNQENKERTDLENLIKNRKEEAKNQKTEIRENLGKKLNSPLIIIQDRVEENEYYLQESIGKAVEKINWNNWKDSNSKTICEEDKTRFYTNIEILKKNNKENKNRELMDCSLPKEIFNLFKNEIQVLEEFFNDSTLLTDNDILNSSTDSSQPIDSNILPAINSIALKIKLISKAIIENDGFNSLIKGLTIEDLEKRAQEFIFVGLTSAEILDNQTKVYLNAIQKRIIPTSQAKKASEISQKNPPTPISTPPKIPLLFQGASGNENAYAALSQNSVFSLLEKIVPLDSAGKNLDINDIANKILAKNNSYKINFSNKNIVSRFFQSAFEAVSGFLFTRHISEAEQLDFQENVAKLMGNYHSGRISILKAQSELNNLYKKYQSTRLKPKGFETFKQLKKLIDQTVDIEKRNPKIVINNLKRQSDKIQSERNQLSQKGFMHFWNSIKDLEHPEPKNGVPESTFKGKSNQQILESLVNSNEINGTQQTGERYFSELYLPINIANLFKPELERLVIALKWTYPNPDDQTKLDPNNLSDTDDAQKELKSAFNDFHLIVNLFIQNLFKDTKKEDYPALIKTLFSRDQEDNNFIKIFQGNRTTLKTALTEELKASITGVFYLHYREEFFPSASDNLISHTSKNNFYESMFNTLVNTAPQNMSGSQTNFSHSSVSSTAKAATVMGSSPKPTGKNAMGEQSASEEENQAKPAGYESDVDSPAKNICISGNEEPEGFPYSDSESDDENFEDTKSHNSTNRLSQ